MKAKRRWMQWVLEESAKNSAPLPWTRTKRSARTAKPAGKRAAR